MEAIAKRLDVEKNERMALVKTDRSTSTRHKPATKINKETFEREVEPYPKAYQYERAERLGVGWRGIGYALKRLGINRKKMFSPPKADVEKSGYR